MGKKTQELQVKLIYLGQFIIIDKGNHLYVNELSKK